MECHAFFSSLIDDNCFFEFRYAKKYIKKSVSGEMSETVIPTNFLTCNKMQIIQMEEVEYHYVMFETVLFQSKEGKTDR